MSLVIGGGNKSHDTSLGNCNPVLETVSLDGHVKILVFVVAESILNICRTYITEPASTFSLYHFVSDSY